MLERRQHLRYELTPPLPGRAFIDGGEQFEAHLLDISIDGARLALSLDGADNWGTLLSGLEKTITGVFARPSGVPWKFVLLHTRMTELALGRVDTDCVVAGRFLSVPTFTAADLDILVAANLATRI